MLGAFEVVLGALDGAGALAAVGAFDEGAALLPFWAAADEPRSAATMATPVSAREFNPETPVTMRFSLDPQPISAGCPLRQARLTQP